MTRKTIGWVTMFAFVALGALAVSGTADARGRNNPHMQPVVYVTGQGLYYDSIVTTPLPPHGPFQLLEMGPNGLQTEFGPGDQGYVGGRWMMDMSGDGQIDAYFSCPLLGPGRLNP